MEINRLNWFEKINLTKGKSQKRLGIYHPLYRWDFYYYSKDLVESKLILSINTFSRYVEILLNFHLLGVAALMVEGRRTVNPLL